MNFSDLAKKYLSNNANSGYSPNDVKEAMQRVRDALGFEAETVFKIDGEIDEANFVNTLRNATRRTDGSLDGDFSLLFNILNQDGNMVLSEAEMRELDTSSAYGQRTGQVSRSEFFVNLYIDDTDIIPNDTSLTSETVEDSESSYALNFEDAVDAFLENNSDYTYEQIMSDMNSIRSAMNHTVDVFGTNNALNVNAVLDETAFIDKMREFTGTADGKLDKEITLLFNILNQDKNGLLSKSELSKIFDTSKRNGDKKGKITYFEIWNNLYLKEREKEEDSPSQNAVASGNPTTATSIKEENEPTISQTSETEVPVQQTESATNEQTIPEEPSVEPAETKEPEVSKPLSEDDINTLAQDISDGKCSLEEYKSRLSIQDYNRLSSAVNALAQISQTEEDSNSAYIIMDGSDESETEQDTQPPIFIDGENETADSVVITTDEAAPATVQVPQNAISEEILSNYNKNGLSALQVENYMSELHSAIKSKDTNMLKFILDNKMSDTDFAYILNSYQDEYGSILFEFSDMAQGSNPNASMFANSIATTITERLVNAAKSGDENAINTLATELSIAASGNIAKSFKYTLFDAVFADGEQNFELISAVANRYKNAYGKDLAEDVINSYHWYSDWGETGNGKKYATFIKQARLGN